MKMKLKYLNLILIISFLFINIKSSYIYAAGSGISDVFNGADKFISSASSSHVTIDQTELKKTSGSIFNILLSVGFVLAIVFTGILGIKFMIGSVEEKAQVKDALIPFVVGCIVIFRSIWNMENFCYICKNIIKSF